MEILERTYSRGVSVSPQTPRYAEITKDDRRESLSPNGVNRGSNRYDLVSGDYNPSSCKEELSSIFTAKMSNSSSGITPILPSTEFGSGLNL